MQPLVTCVEPHAQHATISHLCGTPCTRMQPPCVEPHAHACNHYSPVWNPMHTHATITHLCGTPCTRMQPLLTCALGAAHAALYTCNHSLVTSIAVGAPMQPCNHYSPDSVRSPTRMEPCGAPTHMQFIIHLCMWSPIIFFACVEPHHIIHLCGGPLVLWGAHRADQEGRYH